MEGLGRLFLILGAGLILLGIGLLYSDLFSWFGRLPGDIYIERGPVTIYIPLTTSLIISLIGSLLIYLFSR